MANLKNLIGKALNKAKSSKPSDEGNGTKTRVVKKGMTPKQGMEYKSKETNESIRKGLGKLDDMIFEMKRPGFNPNVPASTKTTKPAPIQAAKEKRDKIQATFGGPKQIASRGGTGMKTELSPAYKESKAADVKRLTQPGGLKSELTKYERSLGKSRKNKFND